jgi:hypothetical protein
LGLSRIGFGLVAIVLSVAALPACDSARSDAGPLYSAVAASIPEDGNCAAQDKAVGAAFNRLLKS